MNLNDLRSQVARSEDSRRRVKCDVTRVDSPAAEMAAFANSEGSLNDADEWSRFPTRFLLR